MPITNLQFHLLLCEISHLEIYLKEIYFLCSGKIGSVKITNKIAGENIAECNDMNYILHLPYLSRSFRISVRSPQTAM